MATQPVNTDLDLQSVSRILNLPDPTLDQHAATKAYVDSASAGLAWKDAVVAASNGSNINLAAPGTTVDGITLAADDRFLAKDQTAGDENGIYVFNGDAVPATRAADANTTDLLEQATVSVEEGTSAGTTFRQTVVNFVLDTDPITWVVFGSAAPAATETTAGVVEIATQGETDAGTDDTRAVTPLKLATYSGAAKRYAASFGDGSATSYVITHNLNTLDVQVYIYENGGSKRQVIAEVQHTSVNSVTILTAAAPAASAYRAVVLA